MILVLGGSGCGKSSYAEGRIRDIMVEKKGRIIYLATMIAYGEEAMRRVERHRMQRAQAGMVTVERPHSISHCLPEICASVPGETFGILLEDMGNLVANELFPLQGGQRELGEVVPKILADVDALSEAAAGMVIVSNNVFEDGVEYGEGTRHYIRALGEINRGLAERSQEVIELVVGIPIWHKGGTFS